MINKPLQQITLADLQRLIDERVCESKTLEYKQDLPGNSDGGPVKILRSISSFANTAGGDLLYGVSAADGIPTGFPGISAASQDEVLLRIESLCRNGLEPRLPYVEFYFVPIGGDKVVLIVRTKRSWSAPHRVTTGGHSHFYGRNSAGCYQLDVGELRHAFAFSETVAERIRTFRADRLMQIGAGETPVPIINQGLMAIHIIPLSAFTMGEAERLSFPTNERGPFAPIGCSAWSALVNLDGYVFYSDRGEDSTAYTQLFRSGVVEAVAVFEPWEGEGHKLPASWIESVVMETVKNCVAALVKKEVESPFYVFLSFMKVKQYKLHTSSYYFPRRASSLDRDNLFLPEVVIESSPFDVATVMRPVFDMLWNAFGYEQSLSYNEDGVWSAR